MRHVLLFLLLPCAALSFLFRDRVIGCDEGQDVVYYDQHAKMFKVSRHSFGNCGFDSIGRLCRAHYADTAYGVSLNRTWEIDGAPRHLYECQDFVRAEVPFIPDGSWSDSIIVDNSSCLTRADLLTAAQYECTRPIRDISFGGQCGDTPTFIEAVFVCDAPPLDFYRSDRHELPYFHERQFQTLRTYTYYHQQLKKARKLWDVQEVERLEKIMSETLDEAGDVYVQMAHYINTTGRHDNDTDIFRNNELRSRRRLLNTLKWSLSYSGFYRSQLLVTIASNLLVGSEEGVERILQLHKDSLRCDEVELINMVTRGSPFPEVRPMMTNLYVDYCKNHTLGVGREHLDFLSETDAVDTLLAMYRKIFRSGVINAEYLPKEDDVAAQRGMLFGLVAAVVLITWVTICRKPSKKEQVLPTWNQHVQYSMNSLASS
ncbi:hypothetical protein QR680_015070 [Steinernema hermaphroditum]|uniref:SUEL-type lectin domain-containing protein n=1 Tax=Steinernema hermaphroditum TaxID=289476 RepID=A0AA39IB24_9BILA|nr:hypothetical protein QR680_015070 [Steinernema hermaphroditum]